MRPVRDGERMLPVFLLAFCVALVLALALALARAIEEGECGRSKTSRKLTCPDSSGCGPCAPTEDRR